MLGGSAKLPPGLMYAVGAMKGNRLVAVALAGHPTGRALRGIDPRRVVEITRVASDGSVKGAASKLVGRLIDILEVSSRTEGKPALLVTYQLASEKGTTYKALRDKGMRPTARLKGRKASGARAGGKGTALPEEDKIRWECCTTPPAAPAKWGLLQQTRQTRLANKSEQESLLGSVPLRHFASGAKHPGEILGFADLGWPVGASFAGIDRKRKAWVRLCTDKCLRALIEAGKKGIPVFLDSGAFSEVDLPRPGEERPPRVISPITDKGWRDRFRAYDLLAKKLGPLANVVAPDMVGFQEQNHSTGSRNTRPMCGP